jgi:hypothetical protein
MSAQCFSAPSAVKKLHSIHNNHLADLPAVPAARHGAMASGALTSALILSEQS